MLTESLEVICSVVYQLFPFGFFSVCFLCECDGQDLCLRLKKIPTLFLKHFFKLFFFFMHEVLNALNLHENVLYITLKAPLGL